MELLTRRCEVRPFTPEDEPALAAILASPAVMAHLGGPCSPEQTRSLLRTAGLGVSPLIHAVWGRGNRKLLGYLIFHPRESGFWELGWVLDRNFWGIGIARELTRAVIDRAEQLGIPGLLIACAPGQTASAAIARDFGFSPAGQKDGFLLFARPLPAKQK